MRCWLSALFLCGFLLLFANGQTFQYSRGWTNGKRAGSAMDYSRNLGRTSSLDEIKKLAFGLIEGDGTEKCTDKLLKCVVRMEQVMRTLSKNKNELWNNYHYNGFVENYGDNQNNDSNIKKQDKRHQSTDTYYEVSKGREASRTNTEDEISNTDDYDRH